MFPGQGAQYAGMGRDLVAHEPRFREEFERCACLLRSDLGVDLAQVIYGTDDRAEATGALDETALTQPALFAVEYSLARVLDSWGIRPHAMVGHSIGEYVAACLAGVFTLEEALMLVAARGRVMQAAPPGRMLAVALSESEAGPFVAAGAELAGVNGPRQCVLSGSQQVIDALAARMEAAGIRARVLPTSHAFHSSLMTVAAAQFERIASRVAFKSPSRPFPPTSPATG
jgi:acyl transferase domain-containing protein